MEVRCGVSQCVCMCRRRAPASAVTAAALGWDEHRAASGAHARSRPNKGKPATACSVRIINSQLSSLWNCCELKGLWCWADEDHERGTGNATRSDEARTVRTQAKRHDSHAGATRALS